MAKQKKKKEVATLTHSEDKRTNIPTAELESVVSKETKGPIKLKYPRNTDLDPQLVWRGKDEQDWSDLVVNAPPLYIQEKVHPKVLIDDLLKRSEKFEEENEEDFQPDLFGDFNGMADLAKSTEFYQHEANWTNRMILGDSLQVMASLAEREGLRGKVQCIYIDPPYGINFNSNFQWSTTSRDVKDRPDHISREPEQVKAFRDTWRDGIHSYLTYLRDRLTVARDLLAETGSIFVQIGDENVHRVRGLLDEVFLPENFVSQIQYRALTPLGSRGLSNVYDYVLWYSRSRGSIKYRNIQLSRPMEDEPEFCFKDDGSGHFVKLSSPPKDSAKVFKRSDLKSSGYTPTCIFDFEFDGLIVRSKGRKSWRTNQIGISRLIKASRLFNLGHSTYFRQYFDDSPMRQMENTWTDTAAGFSDTKTYVVQTHDKIIARCLLMTTDPGDLVLDPTCGSGTSATVSEQWGRRWVTIDTSRVALALARSRLMGARYPYYLLSDSREGQRKEAEITRTVVASKQVHGNVRQGFVLRRVSRVTLGAIANNVEIDVIWEKWQETLEPLRKELNQVLEKNLEEWEIPREPGDPWPDKAAKAFERFQSADTDSKREAALKAINSELKRGYTLDDLPDVPYDLWMDKEAIEIHGKWWEARIARQKEIDASIAAKADFEYLYDRPYEDKNKVRVAGPFTVESLSPHRELGVDENDELIDPHAKGAERDAHEMDFAQVILENLKTAGVQQTAKEDRIKFTSIEGWPGEYISAKATYVEGDSEDAPERTAGVFIGPEFGTVPRQDLVAAARECGDLGLSVLIACAFNYDAHATDFDKLGSVRVLKARMNADLYMADELKKTDKGNLFVIFGEPDIEIQETDGDQIRVKINGVDVFNPATGEVISDDTDKIACWFIDTNYNEESFFVRHAYFLGAGDPYKSLKTTLKAEINREAWDTLYSDVSRPFLKPETGRIAVKVINHLGDEVMKVYAV